MDVVVILVALHVLEDVQNGFSGVQGTDADATEDHFGHTHYDLYDCDALHKFQLGPTIWRSLATPSGLGIIVVVLELDYYGCLIPF